MTELEHSGIRDGLKNLVVCGPEMNTPMAVNLPTFANPPLQEVALSLQFSPLPKMRNAHQGLFWKECLGSSFEITRDANELEHEFEYFGTDRPLTPVGPHGLVRISSSSGSRMWALDKSRSRLVQLQNGRVVLNWTGNSTAGDSYPRFETLAAEFLELKNRLDEFVRAQGLGTTTYNQWEITYVNVICQGVAWDTPDALFRLLPGLLSAKPPSSAGQFERVEGNWHYVLPGEIGRLHIDISQGWKHPHPKAGEPQNLGLRLIARGPVDESGAFESRMRVAHRAIVSTFVELTSPEAHKLWGRIQ